MSEIIRSKMVRVKKERVCFGCGRKFLVGTEMWVDVVADGGQVWNRYLCKTCDGIASAMKWGDEFGFGDLRDEALDIMQEIRDDPDYENMDFLCALIHIYEKCKGEVQENA